MSDDSSTIRNTGEEGRLYELELLMIFFQRAHSRKMDFHLGREVQMAGKFDDLVFKYKQDGKILSRYLQAKHCENEENRITPEVLFPRTGNSRKPLQDKFHLEKYFISFNDIKKHHKRHRDSGELKDLIIFTNVDFDYEQLKISKIEFEEVEDPFVSFKTGKKESKFGKLKIDPESELCEMFYECSDFSRLCVELVAQIKQSRSGEQQKKKKNGVRLGDSELCSKNYATALFSEVIEMGIGQNVVFQKGFLKGGSCLSERARRFRGKFLDTGKEKLKLTEEEFLAEAEKAFVLVTKKLIEERKTGTSELPTDEAKFEDIEEFFRFLVFAVDQPNVGELKDLIANEELRINFGFVNTDFIANSLTNEVLNWINKNRSKEGWLLEQDRENFFGNVDKMIDSLVATGICYSYKKEFVQVADPSKHLKEVENFLRRKGAGCYLIRTEETFLTSCKLYCLIKGLFAEEDSAIFVNSGMLLDELVKEKILGAFERTKCELLMIECRERLDGEVLKKALGTQEKCGKKLLLVALKSLDIRGLSRHFTTQDGKFAFRDLAIVAQKKLLERNIEFQGVPVKIGSVFDASILDRVVEGGMLTALIKDESRLKIGKPYQKQTGFDDEFYIHRNFLFEHRVILKSEKALLKKFKDGFNYPYVVDSTEEESKIVVEEVREADLLESDQRMIFISDTAGMGKSTVLTSLNNRMKQKSPAAWVKRFDLNNFSSLLYKHKERRFDRREEAIQFLVELLAEEGDKEAEIFGYYLEKEESKMVVSFDGLDEVCPDYKGLIMSLIRTLFERTTIGKLVVTTRPTLQEDLEAAFGRPFYYMEPFTDREQIEFLTRFWKKRNPEFEDESRVRRYAQSLIQMLSKCIKDEDKMLTGIPLQTRMVAEIFEKGEDLDEEKIRSGDVSPGAYVNTCVKEYYRSKEEDPSIPLKLNLSDLYRKFVRKKYWDVLKVEKEQMDYTKPGPREVTERTYKEFQKDYKLLAMYTLLPNEYYRTILNDEDKSSIKALVERIKNCKDKSGLVDGIVDGKPQFVHRTFAEYFCVEYMMDYLRQEEGIEEFDRFIFLEVIMKDDYRTIRKFLDTKLGMEEIRQLYQCHKNEWLVEVMSKNGTSAVHEAMKDNNNNIIQFLESCFSDHIKDFIIRNGGDEIIGFAASKGNLKGCQWLSEKGVPVKKGSNALHLAAKSGSLEVVNYLLQCGAHVSGRDASKRVALHYAAEEGHLDIVQELISKGCSISSKDDWGKTPFMLAAAAGKTEVCTFFLENGAKLSEGCNYYNTPLHYAVESGNTRTVEVLLKRGANVNEVNFGGKSPLLIACSAKFGDVCCSTAFKRSSRSIPFEMVRLLLEHKADIHNSDNYWTSPFIAASKTGTPEVVKLLLDLGADFRQKDMGGSSALIWASRMGRIEIAKLLIDKGADCNEKDNDGASVLTVAVQQRNKEIVKLLLDKGALIDQPGDGISSLTAAAYGGDIEIAGLLIDRGANIGCINGISPLVTASHYGNAELVKLLIKHGADVNEKTRHGASPLLVASFRGITAVVKLLIENKANVNDKDEKGTSPLIAAAWNGRTVVVELLLKHGADIYQRDNFGRIPMGARNEAVIGVLTDHERNRKRGEPAESRTEKRNLMKLLIDKGAALPIAKPVRMSP